MGTKISTSELSDLEALKEARRIIAEAVDVSAFRDAQEVTRNITFGSPGAMDFQEAARNQAEFVRRFVPGSGFASRRVEDAVVASNIAGSRFGSAAATVTGQLDAADRIQQKGELFGAAGAILAQDSPIFNVPFTDIDVNIRTAFQGALASLAEMAVLAPVAIATGGGAAVLIGGTSLAEANQAFLSGRREGLSGDKLAMFTIMEGAVEAIPAIIGQRIGVGGLESIFGGKSGVLKAARGGLIAGLKQLGLHTLVEIPEEVFTELAHNLNHVLSGIDPEALTPSRIGQTVADTFVQTAMSMGMAGGPGVVFAGITPKERLKTVQAVRELPENPSRLQMATAMGIAIKNLPDGLKTAAEREAMRQRVQGITIDPEALQQAELAQQQQVETLQTTTTVGETDAETRTEAQNVAQEPEITEAETPPAPVAEESEIADATQTQETQRPEPEEASVPAEPATTRETPQTQEEIVVPPRPPEQTTTEHTQESTEQVNNTATMDFSKGFALKEEHEEAIRIELGLEGPQSKTTTTRQEIYDEALSAGIPNNAPSMASEILAEPRLMTAVELAGLRARVATNGVDLLKLDEQIASEADTVTRGSLRTERERIGRETEMLLSAKRASASATGLALSELQETLGTQYDEASLNDRMQHAKGSEKLTRAERTKNKNTAKTIKTKTKEVETAKVENDSALAEGYLTSRPKAQHLAGMSIEKKDKLRDQQIAKLQKLKKEGCDA